MAATTTPRLNGGTRRQQQQHLLKDDVADRTFDFSLKRLTSIRATATDMSPGFDPPSHLRTSILLDVAGYRVHPRQDPQSGDYIPEPKRRKLARTGSELIVPNDAIQFLTRLVQDFHPRYKALIVDKLWAFPTEDGRKMLPPKWGEAPKKTLYSHIWVQVKGSGSHYCHLKPGEHASSSIRFVLSYDGTLAQECWSQKVGMAGKPCCRSSTKGGASFLDKVMPADYGPLTDLFLTR